jgi:predicted dehydrogenase
MKPNDPSISRRTFVQASAAVAATALAARAGSAQGKPAAGAPLRVGVIGCGGRGTGAAMDAVAASPRVRIVALGDAFEDRVKGSREELAKHGERSAVAPERCFSGFDAYEKVLGAGVDLVILATPPGFRPLHLAAAVAAGKHVFLEKPVAVDPAGVRSVLASAESATKQGLSIVAGTQRRHEACYLEAMRRVHAGEIGEVVGASCYWNQGGLWVKERQSGWSDVEWQVRNWLYFTWLSGDHICEQHVHNIDVCNWALGATPVRAIGVGGRQVRTEAKYGNVFDHFAIEYEYAGGQRVQSFCRQIDGCDGRVEEVVRGTKGTLVTRSGSAVITWKDGREPWVFEGENPNPYVTEHKDLIAAIEGGTPLNEAKRIAESTQTAILGRMSAYTGKDVTWEQALNSKLDLVPKPVVLGPLPAAEVAVPGRTPLV